MKLHLTHLRHSTCRGSVLSSGTVGAALEGCIAGRKAVAVSFPFFHGWDNWAPADVDTAVQVAPLPTTSKLPWRVTRISRSASISLSWLMELATLSIDGCLTFACMATTQPTPFCILIVMKAGCQDVNTEYMQALMGVDGRLQGGL